MDISSIFFVTSGKILREASSVKVEVSYLNPLRMVEEVQLQLEVQRLLGALISIFLLKYEAQMQTIAAALHNLNVQQQPPVRDNVERASNNDAEDDEEANLFAAAAAEHPYRYKTLSGKEPPLIQTDLEKHEEEEAIIGREWKLVPHDVVEVILECVPVKPLLRFRSVSKKWKLTIDSPGFKERQLIRRRQLRVPDILIMRLSYDEHVEHEGRGRKVVLSVASRRKIGADKAVVTYCEFFDFSTNVVPASPYPINAYHKPVHLDGSLYWSTECEPPLVHLTLATSPCASSITACACLRKKSSPK
ncbi:hypothetical protein F2Q68_00033384 [Brassica cretica]|uniref:F-box domain-containing protein n=2 Tax=Brassica TaxID=3705 RepID=A0A8S9H754_BRACR|nr:hypothetical protein F2Q68_00033384 [Brassica cretica]